VDCVRVQIGTTGPMSGPQPVPSPLGRGSSPDEPRSGGGGQLDALGQGLGGSVGTPTGDATKERGPRERERVATQQLTFSFCVAWLINLSSFLSFSSAPPLAEHSPSFSTCHLLLIRPCVILPRTNLQPCLILKQACFFGYLVSLEHLTILTKYVQKVIVSDWGRKDRLFPPPDLPF